MYVVELRKTLRRPRTWVLVGLLAAFAILPVAVLAISGGGNGGGPTFFDLIRETGLAAPLAVMLFIQPVVLPLGVSLLAGEAIALEASGGTLRYLLVRPVGRVRLVVTKYAAVMTLLLAAMAWVLAVAVVSGGIAYGLHPLPTLSGATLGTGTALGRIAAAGLYLVTQVAGLAAIGLFCSTLTESAIGAGAITLLVSIASQILDALSQVAVIHPYLPSHEWLAFADLFRSPVAWTGIEHGLWLALGYTVVFVGLSLLAFTRKDVTS